MKKEISRRDFIKATAVTGAGFLVAAGNFHKPARASALQGIAVACIGVGNQGARDTRNAGYFCHTVGNYNGHIVALCDVDQDMLNGSGEKYSAARDFPDAKKFVDYRDVFEEMAGKVDACTISTPDHMHAIITATAMKYGVHVYTQAPLTRTIYEARYLAELARKNPGLCTQMGDHYSLAPEFRRTAAQYKAGVIGEIREIHFLGSDFGILGSISDHKPYMMTMEKYSREMREKYSMDDAEDAIAKMKFQIKKDLKKFAWDLWLGVAPEREYWPEDPYHRYWNHWWDFGTGYMGCIRQVATNMMFRALELKDPTYAVATSSGHDNKTFPKEVTIEIDFPENEWRGPVKCYWYSNESEGKSALREELRKYDYGDPIHFNTVVLGEKGAGFNKCSGTDEGSLQDDYLQDKFYEEYGDEIPRIPESQTKVVFSPVEEQWHPTKRLINVYATAHICEWLYAIQEGKPELCSSNFANHAGPLCESLLVGNLALWGANEPNIRGEIEWDSASMSVKNLKDVPGLENLIKPVYQNGYEQLDQIS